MNANISRRILQQIKKSINDCNMYNFIFDMFDCEVAQDIFVVRSHIYSKDAVYKINIDIYDHVNNNYIMSISKNFYNKKYEIRFYVCQLEPYRVYDDEYVINSLLNHPKFKHKMPYYLDLFMEAK